MLLACASSSAHVCLSPRLCRIPAMATLTVELIWQPDATSAPLVLDLREFFRRINGD